MTYPAGYQPGTRYPLVVEVHGGPSSWWEDRVMLDWHDWAQMLASRGYAVLMPNPRGSTGYGRELQRLLQDDVGGGESRDLVAGALAMVERGADPDRLGIAGWSWGGYLTAWTITQTTIFRAAVMGAGLSNMVSDHGQGDIPSANLLYYRVSRMTIWRTTGIVADTLCRGGTDADLDPARRGRRARPSRSGHGVLPRIENPRCPGPLRPLPAGEAWHRGTSPSDRPDAADHRLVRSVSLGSPSS